MGHMGNGKDLYRDLGHKIDGLPARAPCTDALQRILKELYTSEEAKVAVKMPYGLSTFERIAATTGTEPLRLQRILEGLCSKGLVVDLWLNEAYHYMLSPFVIGIFELTMMRVGGNAHPKKWAQLFHEYMREDSPFYAANFQQGEQVSGLRTLPHEGAVVGEEYLEVLDFEKATFLVQEASRCSIGICSCRHEKHHMDAQACNTPLEMCTSFGYTAEFMIRRNFGREVPKEQVLANLDQAKELGLVLNADNVQRNAAFICFCCKCCCNALAAISKHGYANAIVTSNYLAEPDGISCTGCGKCARECPIECIAMIPSSLPQPSPKKIPQVDVSLCLGCGICRVKCPNGSMEMVQRGKRVLTPETTFQKVLLSALERGTLQNQIFDDPQSVTHRFMQGFLGGFLRLPPVKKGLLSDRFRSRFLNFMETNARRQGRGWTVEL